LLNAGLVLGYATIGVLTNHKVVKGVATRGQSAIVWLLGLSYIRLSMMKQKILFTICAVTPLYMKRACVLLVFVAIYVASFCQIEYSTYRHFNWIAVTPNYYADYEKVLAHNKVKSVTEIISRYEGCKPTDSFYVYEIDKKGRRVKFLSKQFNYK
jgi:hypothetical protein